MSKRKVILEPKQIDPYESEMVEDFSTAGGSETPNESDSSDLVSEEIEEKLRQEGNKGTIYNFPKDISKFASGIMDENRLSKMFETFGEIVDIPGDIVEIGTESGKTAAFLRACCSHFDAEKEVYIYDSFPCDPMYTGSRVKIEMDEDWITNEQAIPCDVDKGIERVRETFRLFNLSLPRIHPGWLSQTLPQELPDKIAFAHIDVNFEPSTMQALVSVYPKLQKGSVVFVDDYMLSLFPGVERAVTRFLKDKPEKIKRTTAIQGCFTKQG